MLLKQLNGILEQMPQWPGACSCSSVRACRSFSPFVRISIPLQNGCYVISMCRSTVTMAAFQRTLSISLLTASLKRSIAQPIGFQHRHRYRTIHAGTHARNSNLLPVKANGEDAVAVCSIRDDLRNLIDTGSMYMLSPFSIFTVPFFSVHRRLTSQLLINTDTLDGGRNFI